MSRKLKFAIIGCGSIAKRHAIHISNYAELTAVCDLLPEKTASFCLQYQVPAFTTPASMLAADLPIDVVVVCTPNGLHATHSIQAIQAGKHVICEKPMAIDTADCLAMIAAAEQMDRKLFVVKQNRYNPPVIAVKNLLDNNNFGKLYSFQLSCFWNRDAAYYNNSWKGSSDLDGGTLFTQFSHFIDLLYWMFGDVKSIHAVQGNFAHQGIIDFEDTGAVILEMNNGMIGTINYTVNARGKNMEGSLAIFGEKGTVKIGGEYLNRLDYENIEGITIGPLSPGKPSNNYGNYQGSMSNHDKVYENVLAVINHEQPIDTTVFEAMKTVEIIQRIYQSANQIKL